MPMADAVTNARSPGVAAATSASLRVGRIRLARISFLRSAVNRPPIEAGRGVSITSVTSVAPSPAGLNWCVCRQGSGREVSESAKEFGGS
jgi:hypothetical protein